MPRDSYSCFAELALRESFAQEHAIKELRNFRPCSSLGRALAAGDLDHVANGDEVVEA
jgi:hypothetical protein